MISNSGTSTLGLYDLKRQIDTFGGVDYFRPTLVGGYLLNARVMLANGDIVKSTIDGNANDPNVDMTGWELPQASGIFDKSGLSQQEINDFFRQGYITSSMVGCKSSNTGLQNSTLLKSALEIGKKVIVLGEKYTEIEVTNKAEIAGLMLADKLSLSETYNRTLLKLNGVGNKVDLVIDMQDSGCGGLELSPTTSDSNVNITVKNIYGANRTTYGLQNAVYDHGKNNTINAYCVNILQGDSGVDPQPSAFTASSTADGGSYNIEMDNVQGGTVFANTKLCNVGKIIAKRVHDNATYHLENSNTDIGSVSAIECTGEIIVNAGGYANIDNLYIEECSGYGNNFSKSGTTIINSIVVKNTVDTSRMPLLSMRTDNIASKLSIGSITGETVISGTDATILNGVFQFVNGSTDLTISDVDLKLNYVSGSSKNAAHFSGVSALSLGNWNIELVDKTSTLTSSDIISFILPTAAIKNGSKIGLQKYIASPAIIRMTNVGEPHGISFAVGQPVQGNISPCISSFYQPKNRIFYVSALPSSGKWYSGDVLFNTGSKNIVRLGWVCVRDGDFSGIAPLFEVITTNTTDLRSGTTGNRPTNVGVGYPYFDTTLGKPIYVKVITPSIVWVDATGVTV